MERVSVNLHVCAREELRDTVESIATSRSTLSTADCVQSLDAVTSDVVHEHGRLGLLGFARLDPLWE
jgi:hypothetical protein